MCPGSPLGASLRHFAARATYGTSGPRRRSPRRRKCSVIVRLQRCRPETSSTQTTPYSAFFDTPLRPELRPHLRGGHTATCEPAPVRPLRGKRKRRRVAALQNTPGQMRRLWSAVMESPLSLLAERATPGSAPRCGQGSGLRPFDFAQGRRWAVRPRPVGAPERSGCAIEWEGPHRVPDWDAEARAGWQTRAE